jgi:hypothetical protein
MFGTVFDGDCWSRDAGTELFAMNDNPGSIPFFAETHTSTGEPEPAQM